jgi:hypothetical protein
MKITVQTVEFANMGSGWEAFGKQMGANGKQMGSKI